MNKSFKIRINYAIGLLLSLLLGWVLYKQVHEQWIKMEGQGPLGTGAPGWLLLAIALGIVNLLLEVWKWHYLVTRSDYISFAQAAKSLFTGIALSFITPNRIGEYPGRLIALEKKNTMRLISMSVLGAFAQMYMAILAGNAGLAYFYLYHGQGQWWLPWVMWGNVLSTFLLSLFFFRFEFFAARLEGIRWLRKYFTYRRIVQRVGLREQMKILGISALRYVAFSLELAALLHYFQVNIALHHLLLLGTLFFWLMTMIPSIALAELGIRGQLSAWLYGLMSGNVIGVLLATFLLWIINLVVPALVGAVIVFRKKWIA